MRLLVVGAGSSYSTKDVEVGYYQALANLGHELIPYGLDHRIDAAADYLRFLRRRLKVKDKPTRADADYLASQGVLERALSNEVDGVLVVAANHLHHKVYPLLRRVGIHTAAILTESPYEDESYAEILPYLDIAWTNERTSAKRLGISYLPACYGMWHYPNSRRMTLDDIVGHHDVVFVGSGFPERAKLLESVDWSGIDLGLYGDWHTLPARSRLRKHLRGGVVENAITGQLYRNARVALNLYRDSDTAESLNPRAYEIAACGAVQVSQYRVEADDVLGGAVLFFGEHRSLEETIRTALAGDSGQLAQWALEQVQGHTFMARAQQVERDLYSAWGLEPVRPQVA